MNIFSDDGSQVKDSTGKWWSTETWHPRPSPHGLDPIYNNGGMNGLLDETSTHWLVRKPLPPVPRVKTQEEAQRMQDEEALNWWWISKNNTVSPQSAWHAALAWERARNP